MKTTYDGPKEGIPKNKDTLYPARREEIELYRQISESKILAN